MKGPELRELLFEAMVRKERKLERFDVHGAFGLERTALLMGRALARADRATHQKLSENAAVEDFLHDGHFASAETMDEIFDRAEAFLFRENDEPSLRLKDGPLPLEDYYSTVYTPNSSAVTVIVMTYELSAARIAATNAAAESNYPNATRETNASRRYNCHSYAWYSQSTSNIRWMNTPGDDKYWQDSSYVSGPIKWSSRVSYGNDDHSAIAISGSSYRSKWGQWPRMVHAR